uniref:heterogeneous nuclear ribonucleoprotein Q-like isoform X2 n=1 Tax=Erigeron canadensis TaxID=72917 RepID=UPI001CB9CF09|nr:heterogeneous nuclear ribonucleoprotein Q-like isoform X2 [Erigeron canadensis]
MQQQSPPPPSSSSMTPFKKRLLHRVEDPKFEEKEGEQYVVEKQERPNIEYKNSSYEEEGEYQRGVDQVRGERSGGEHMTERDGKGEEEDPSEDNFYDEHGFDPDGYKKERHDVVRERQKKKELEVFVGGLDRETTEVDLREVFNQVGDITEVRLLMNPMTNKNKGFAFIRFATVEQARRALNDFKRPTINGKQCGVAPSQDSDTLFVGNICKTWSKDMLKEKLVRYGIDKFEELTLVEDTKNEGMNRGFAFLDFPSRADALEACRRLQKRDVIFGTDRTARVAFADTFIEPDDEIMAQVRTVFVDGLPPSWEEDIIKDHLRQFGKIEKVELARNMPAAKRDDFGFITFSTHESAVSCVDGINDSELVFRNKKVKVRARLSRPRQRGKSAKYARGGYTVGADSYGGYSSSWEPSGNRLDSHRFGDRGRRSIRDRSPYDGGRRRSFSSRDDRGYDVSVSDRIGSKRPYTSTDRSLRRRSPVYERSSFKTEYTRHNAGISSTERPIYRDSYSSRGAGYMEESSRTATRVPNRGSSQLYDDDDDRYMYIEHPSRYNDGSSRNFSSTSGLKRPYSSIEEHHPRYSETSRRQSRPDFDYANSSELVYNDRAYGSESTRVAHGSRSGYNGSNQGSTAHSHGLYDKNTSNVGYRRGIDNEEPEEMYSRYGRERDSRDYIPSRSDMRADSYSPPYSNHRVTDGYVGGRGSDSYY